MTLARERCVALPTWLLVTLLTVSCTGEDLPRGAEQVDPDEAAISDRMIAAIERSTLARRENGVVPRLNQAKSLGCFDATFTVENALPAELRHGLFAQPGPHPARVRFANASTADDRDKDFRGLSIQVAEVDGDVLWGEPGRQDFLLNSHPVLFAADPREFLAFIEAGADDALWKFFVNPLNWDSLLVILRGRDSIASPFDIDYWSTTPYRLGPDPAVAVKYAAQACTAPPGAMPEEPGADFLRTVMQQQLDAGEACFDFMVQFQGDPDDMPIEDASVLWDEDAAPFRKVAQLRIRNQAFATPQALQACETARFNPWQSLDAHRPIGGINRVRQAVYEAAGDFRLRESR